MGCLIRLIRWYCNRRKLEFRPFRAEISWGKS
jgi:hypothetical protein